MEFLLVYDFGKDSKHAYSDRIKGDNLETIIKEWRANSNHDEYRIIGIVPIGKYESELSYDFDNMNNFKEGNRLIDNLRSKIAISCGSWEI